MAKKIEDREEKWIPHSHPKVSVISIANQTLSDVKEKTQKNTQNGETEALNVWHMDKKRVKKIQRNVQPASTDSRRHAASANCEIIIGVN